MQTHHHTYECVAFVHLHSFRMWKRKINNKFPYISTQSVNIWTFLNGENKCLHISLPSLFIFFFYKLTEIVFFQHWNLLEYFSMENTFFIYFLILIRFHSWDHFIDVNIHTLCCFHMSKDERGTLRLNWYLFTYPEYILLHIDLCLDRLSYTLRLDFSFSINIRWARE